MTNITPSKWEVIYSKYPNDPKEIVIGVGINTKVKGGVYTEMICESLLPETDEEYIKQHEKILADMRLIAAAPELLENLTRIIDRIKENNLQGSFPSAFERAEKLLKSINQ